MSNEVRSLIYTPAESVSAAVKYVEDARRNIELGLGLRFPIDKIAQEYPVPPLMPGKILTFQGKSHNGKSMFLDFWKSNLAEHLERNHRSEDIIISILAEDMVEEQMAYELMRQAEKMNMRGKMSSMDNIKIVAAEIAATPIYYIGASILRAGESEIQPTMTNIGRAIDMIIEERKDAGKSTNIQGGFADYIQAMPLDNDVLGNMPDKTRRLQVRADFYGLRKLAARLPAPFVLASQSKQTLGGGQPDTMQTPYLYDHQETSAIPQHTDTDFSIWMPKTDLEFGTKQTHKGKHDIMYDVSDDLAWLRCNKQRGFNVETFERLPAGMKWPLRIDYKTGTYDVADLESMSL